MQIITAIFVYFTSGCTWLSPTNFDKLKLEKDCQNILSTFRSALNISLSILQYISILNSLLNQVLYLIMIKMNWSLEIAQKKAQSGSNKYSIYWDILLYFCLNIMYLLFYFMRVILFFNIFFILYRIYVLRKNFCVNFIV